MRVALRLINIAVWIAIFVSVAKDHWNDTGRVIGNAVLPLIAAVCIDFAVKPKRAKRDATHG